MNPKIKRWLVFTSLLLTLIVAFWGSRSYAQGDYLWFRTTVDSEGNVGAHTSLALDGNIPSISYFDASNSALKYAHLVGSTWQVETVDNTGYDGWSTSLALDSAGHPHISYHEYHGGILKYAHHDGTTWQIEDVESYGARYGLYNSLALDSAGHPHIAYSKVGTSWSTLRYAYYDGTTWHKETVDGLGDEDVGYFVSLALDADDHPHISYQDVTNLNLRYAYYDGSTWHIEVVDSGLRVGYHTSLALDSAGHPHIAYYDDGENTLNYAYYDGSAWHIERVVQFLYKAQISLALDSNGHPHIGYCGEICPIECEEGLYHAYYDGAAWHRERVDAGEITFASLALDDEGQVHIGYYDADNGDLRYAHTISPSSLTNRLYLPLVVRNYQP